MQGTFYLGEWRVDPDLCRLAAGNRIVRVRARVMDLLVYLAARQGQVVSKDKLLDEVWGSQAISESALTRTVTELRQALGDTAEASRVLETIPKRGYRLIAPVIPASPPAPVASAPAPSASARGRFPMSRVIALAGAATALLVAGLWVWETRQRLNGSDLAAAGVRADVPFTARNWVLVVPFTNRTGEPGFDDVLEQALEHELVGSGFVNVVPRPRVEDVLALMSQPSDQRLDRSLAREVALRDGGIRALLTGSIVKVGKTYALETEILDPVSGRVLADITDDVSAPGDLLPRVRALALRVRQALGEALPSVEQNRLVLQAVTTPSFQALQLYSKAAALLDGDVWRWRPEAISRYATAEALLRKAVEADPRFASAWFLLAHAVSRQNRPRAEYLPLAERAVALSGGAGPTERYLIEGLAHRLRYDRTEFDRSKLAKAAQAYEALLQLVPDHYWTLAELIEIYRELGRTDDSERVTLHAAALRPHSPLFAIEAAKVHVERGDLPAARAVVTRVLAGDEQPVDRAVSPYDKLGWARLWEAHQAWLNGDVKRALDVVRAAEQRSLNSSTVVWHAQLAAIYAGLGRIDDGLRVIERIQPEERRSWFRALMAFRGSRWEALRNMLQPERRDFDVLDRHFFMLVHAGLLRDAEWVVSERRRRRLSAPWFQRAEREGQLRAAQGRYAEAMALMEPLKTIAGTRFYTDDAMAVSRRAVGDLPGAIRELERVSRPRAVTGADGWQVVSWLACRVRLAEFYRQAGRHAEAGQVFAEVRNLLAVADADHPLWRRVPKS